MASFTKLERAASHERNHMGIRSQNQVNCLEMAKSGEVSSLRALFADAIFLVAAAAGCLATPLSDPCLAQTAWTTESPLSGAGLKFPPSICCRADRQNARSAARSEDLIGWRRTQDQRPGKANGKLVAGKPAQSRESPIPAPPIRINKSPSIVEGARGEECNNFAIASSVGPTHLIPPL